MPDILNWLWATYNRLTCTHQWVFVFQVWDRYWVFPLKWILKDLYKCELCGKEKLVDLPPFVP